MKHFLRCVLFGVLAGCGGSTDATPIATSLPRASGSASTSASRPSPDCAGAVASFKPMYEEALAAASSGHSDPNVKKLVDANVDALTSDYVAGCVDDAARKDLVKLLWTIRDPRTSPALAKAFNDYTLGKTDEDVKFAAESVAEMAKDNVKLDRSVVDGLWACFIKYRPSKTNSIMGTQALHDAILAVKDPSYGDKAITAIGARVVLDESPGSGTTRVNDQLEFWQTTALQVIKVLHYTPAAKHLVRVLMTRNKLAIARLAKSAILQMPRDAEPFLAAALDGSDPELATLRADWDADKGYVLNLLDVLAYTSLDIARDAIIAAVPQMDNDTNRAGAAQMLVFFPTTPALVATFKSIYAKLPPIADKGGENDTGAERARLLGVVSEFFDPSLGAWALTESAGAHGTNKLSAKVGALQSAIKLMRPADKPNVERALKSLEQSRDVSPREKTDVTDNVRGVFKAAAEALDKCASNTACYLKVLEEPIPQTRSANWRAIKAAQMAGVLGNEQTRKGLIAHIPKVTDPAVRLAMSSAINHLAPKGDNADADAIDAIVEGDTARKDNEALRGDDALTKVALMLRARAL